MNVTIERLFEKIGRLHLSQDLLVEENMALKVAKEAIRAEVEKIEKEAETDVSKVLVRLKTLL
jgi:regulator of replication initiation timing